MANVHTSHDWKEHRCSACGSLDSWPLAGQQCPLAGTSDGDRGKGRRILSDDDVRHWYGRVLSGELSLAEASRQSGVHYSALWRRARRLGMPVVQTRTSHDWEKILPRVRELLASGRSTRSAAQAVGIAPGVLHRKLKDAAS